MGADGLRSSFHLKLVLISDTHTRHHALTIPPCDILIHAGDITFQGEQHCMDDFLLWLKDQPAKHKVFINGNHEVWPERHPEEFRALLEKRGLHQRAFHYLENDSCIIEGLKIYGSPFQPTLLKIYGSPFQPTFDWSYQRSRGDEMAKIWAKIPKDTDILVTHGPSHGTLDWSHYSKSSAGCEELKKVIEEIKPKLFVCGHVHTSYGVVKRSYGTIHVNASICDEAYEPTHKPVEIEL